MNYSEGGRLQNGLWRGGGGGNPSFTPTKLGGGVQKSFKPC